MVTVFFVKRIGGSNYEVAPWIFMIFLLSISHDGLLKYVFTRPFLVRLGRVCYSVYLFHFLFLHLTESAGKKAFDIIGVSSFPIEIRYLIWTGIMACLLMVLGELSFKYFEMPLVRFGKRVASRFG